MLDKTITYKNFTAKEVRAWLYEGADNGLSEKIITKTRANSIIHNPFVDDDMVIVVVALCGEKVVGYTAMFPEHLKRPDVWISNATTLYADPQYSSEFIGYYVSKVLHDNANGRYVIGSDIASATVLIDKLLGLKPYVFNRRRFVINRKFRATSLRLLCSKIVEPFRKLRQSYFINKIQSYINDSLSVKFVDFIDDESYRFILSHSANDIFVRSQEMLNWLIRYPFRVERVKCVGCDSTNLFSDICDNFKMYIAQIRDNNMIQGIYMFAVRDNDIHVLLLYYSDEFKNDIYSFLLKTIISLNPSQLFSVYDDFNNFVENSNVSLKFYNHQFVFTLPPKFEIDTNRSMQGADGDMFA